jgi:aryl-alcohol dehydrogenase-like predicted oxidoreductase
MESRTLGQTGLQVSVLGFGGAEIGFQSADPVEVKRLLDAALDDGLNVIDTAECYKASEEMIGNAVSGRRSDFHLFTKTGHMEDGDHWNPAKMTAQIERSLKRLKTSHVDFAATA